MLRRSSWSSTRTATRSSSRRWLAAVAGTALVFAACSSDDGDGGDVMTGDSTESTDGATGDTATDVTATDEAPTDDTATDGTGTDGTGDGDDDGSAVARLRGRRHGRRQWVWCTARTVRRSGRSVR